MGQDFPVVRLCGPKQAAADGREGRSPTRVCWPAGRLPDLAASATIPPTSPSLQRSCTPVRLDDATADDRDVSCIEQRRRVTRCTQWMWYPAATSSRLAPGARRHPRQVSSGVRAQMRGGVELGSGPEEGVGPEPSGSARVQRQRGRIRRTPLSCLGLRVQRPRGNGHMDGAVPVRMATRRLFLRRRPRVGRSAEASL
jgi:hypothetical protein